MTREEVQRASERVDAPKQQIYNDILVISDPQKAAEDKIKVDMARRKAARPSQIMGYVVMCFVLAGAGAYIAHKLGYLDYAWCILVWCLTPLPVIGWFAAWASANYIPYSPNTIYWLATAKQNVHKMSLSKARGGRYPWPATLNVYTKQENGKFKETNIDLGYLPHRCDDISQDIVDLTLDDEEGIWFEPAERQRRESEQYVMSMTQWVKYYEEQT